MADQDGPWTPPPDPDPRATRGFCSRVERSGAILAGWTALAGFEPAADSQERP